MKYSFAILAFLIFSCKSENMLRFKHRRNWSEKDLILTKENDRLQQEFVFDIYESSDEEEYHTLTIDFKDKSKIDFLRKLKEADFKVADGGEEIES